MQPLHWPITLDVPPTAKNDPPFSPAPVPPQETASNNASITGMVTPPAAPPVESPQEAVVNNNPATGSPTIAVPPAVPPALPALPEIRIQSRMDRFIFACDVPLPLTVEEDIKQREALENKVRAWADTIGVNTSFSDISNGVQATIEAKTKEARARFVSMGIMDGITKIILEVRVIDRRRIIVARADLPNKYQILRGLTPDPATSGIVDGIKLIASFLGAPQEACHLI